MKQPDSHLFNSMQTRYTAVRRQTAPAPGAKETQVLDYQNVAAELLPTIAAAYALKFMGQVRVMNAYIT